MAYDNFEDTPFDLNHDGKIDSNEAAYIYETFYNEDNQSSEDDEDYVVDGGYSSSSYHRSKPEKSQMMKELDERFKQIHQEYIERQQMKVKFFVVLFIALTLIGMLSKV